MTDKKKSLVEINSLEELENAVKEKQGRIRKVIYKHHNVELNGRPMEDLSRAMEAISCKKCFWLVTIFGAYEDVLKLITSIRKSWDEIALTDDEFKAAVCELECGIKMTTDAVENGGYGEDGDGINNRKHINDTRKALEKLKLQKPFGGKA